MRLRMFFFVATLMGFSGAALGAWLPVSSPIADQVPQVDISSKTASIWQMDVSIPGFTLEPYTSNGKTYDRLNLPDQIMAEGDEETELPSITRIMALRSLGDPELEVLSEEWMELEGTYELEYAENATADEYLPAVSSGVTPRQVMGGVSLAVVYVNAAKYNPVQKKMRVLKTVEILVHESGPAIQYDRPITETTASILRAVVPNWDEVSVDVEVVRGTLLYIFRSTALLDNIQGLATWRARKGYTVELCDPAQITWTTTGIKNYIQNRYNVADPPLEFVCLLGDNDGTYAVPAWSQSGGVGDFSYSRLDGNDLLPDVHVGRCCFDTEGELDVIVSKILGYERNPASPSGGGNPSWFKGGGLFAGSGSGISPVQLMRWTRERMLEVGYTSSSIDTVYYIHESVTGAKMTSSINSGISLYAYRGYLRMEDFDQDDIGNLNNYWRLPFMVTITCGTNDFNYDDAASSVCECLLKAGSTAYPTGVIGAIGTSSMATHTRFNNCLVGGVFQGLLREGIYTTGGSISRSKIELRLNYPLDSSYVDDFCHYESLIGDPAVDVFTDTPETLFVDNPASIPMGTNTLTLTVTCEQGQPVQDVYVNLVKGSEIFTGDWTDANGQVVFNFTTTSAESLFVTATKHNHRPAINHTLVTSSTRFVSPASSTFVIDDDNNGESHGDRNGLANPGETIELAVPLKNWGTSTAYGVEAELSLTDPFVVSIGDNYEAYGDIAPGATVPPPDDFNFTLADYAPDGHVLQFTLTVSDASNTWISSVPIPVSNANLEYKGHLVTGAGGNGVLDPGETGQLQLKLSNIGTRGTLFGTRGYLRSENPAVTVSDSVGTFSASNPGGQCDNYSDLFGLFATNFAFHGERIPLTCVFPTANGFADTVCFTLNIGTVASNTPTPPDSYGYWAYDNTDIGYPKRPVSADSGWVEIDPHYGGSGTSLGIIDDHDEGDMTVVANLPFTFKYYGQEFDQISVCSNGWLAMGADQVVHSDFRNHTIPGALGPSGMIAPFWDDLWVVETVLSGSEFGDKELEPEANHPSSDGHLDDCVPDFQISVNRSGYTSPVRTTCGAGDDCATRTQEDHIYEIQILESASYTFTLCNSPGGPQAWDSYMYLDGQCCGTSHMASNDDGCIIHGLSLFTIALSPGTYYLLIEGYYPDNCGEYQLEIACPQTPVYNYHDAPNHRFVVEWSRVTKYNAGTNPTETFECILYEPGYPATPTGDGEILFQYLTCTNTYDVGSSNDYATVGIENLTETDGVLYSYWNIAAHGAASLVSGRAILFTTAKHPYATPQSPTDLTAVRSGNDIQLCWNAVRSDTLNNPITVDGYKLYRDVSPFFAPGVGSYLGTTADTAYLDVNAVSGSKYFYVVQAYLSGSLASGTTVPQGESNAVAPKRPSTSPAKPR